MANIVIPDVDVLSYLASNGLLGALLRTADRVTITDAAYYESRNAAGIQEFVSSNPDRVTVERTVFHEQIRRATADPAFPLPPDMVELAVYGCVNNIRTHPTIPTLIILADDWFTKNQAGVMPDGVQCLPLSAFLASPGYNR